MHSANTEIRILIIDDDEDDFFITSEYIKGIPGRKFIIDWCYQYQEGRDKICEGNYDLYFIDYILGAKTGLDLLKEVVKNNCEEPIILLTGKGNHQVDIEAMRAGAFDYQVKPELTVEKMERCIRYALDKTASLKALKTNERKFRSFFEKSKDAVFLANEKLYFREVNSSMAKLFQITKEELCELNLYNLLGSKKEQEILEEQMNKVNEVDDKEVEFITKTGDKKSCILSIAKEKDEHGRIYIQGIIHDITNLKKAEKANLQAEKLGATGRLAWILAHEIRNPLNNINLSIEQLRSETNHEESKMYLDIINRNSKTINDIISQLLNSSRPTEIVLQNAAIQKIMDEAIDKALDRINLKKIQLDVFYPKQPALIHADAEKLKIAFLNIIINSIEAMEEEKGQLKISVKENGVDYIINIQDNGCGISDENLTRLFEPYFTSKRNGLGLGLASTLNILQSHKGLIEVKTTPGVGTIFVLTFKKSNAL